MAAQLLRSAIQTLTEASEGIADLAVDSANLFLGIFGQHVRPPDLVVPALRALENVTLPRAFVDSVTNLRQLFPNVTQLRSGAEDGLFLSITRLQDQINSSMPRTDHAYSDRSLCAYG